MRFVVAQDTIFIDRQRRDFGVDRTLSNRVGCLKTGCFRDLPPMLGLDRRLRVQHDIYKRVVPHGRGDVQGIDGQATGMARQRVTLGDV